MRQRQARVRLTITNLWWLCAMFLGAITLHASIALPILLGRIEKTIARSLNESIENQNANTAQLSEQLYRIARHLDTAKADDR